MSQIVKKALALIEENRDRRIKEISSQIINHMQEYGRAAATLEFYASQTDLSMDLDPARAAMWAVAELRKTQAERAVVAIVTSLLACTHCDA